jgi:hypothetical protein
MSDPVNHPGNVVKYVSRAGRKGSELGDLRKDAHGAALSAIHWLLQGATNG